jgi:hypothetical protein
MTKLLKPDGNQTKDTAETISLMINAFAPKDNKLEDDDYHKTVLVLTEQPVDTENSQFKKSATSLRV